MADDLKICPPDIRSSDGAFQKIMNLNIIQSRGGLIQPSLGHQPRQRGVLLPLLQDGRRRQVQDQDQELQVGCELHLPQGGVCGGGVPH